MFKTLTIKKYQSHDNTVLNFCRGINCIIGESQKGKTAILRAISWLINDRPLGFRFHSKFAKTQVTAVKVRLDDDTAIQLSKNKKKAKYEMVEPNGEVHNWVGSVVPDLVKEKFNMSELNIQNQLDSHFLITSSPGEIARIINKITKLDMTNEWIKKITNNINVLKYKKEVDEEELENIIEKLIPLRKLPIVNRLLNQSERLAKRRYKLENEYIEIDGTLAEIENLEKNIKQEQKYLKAQTVINQIDEVQKQMVELQNERDLIKEALNEQEEIRKTKKWQKKYIKEYTAMLKKKGICPVCFSPIETEDIERIINALPMHQ